MLLPAMLLRVSYAAMISSSISSQQYVTLQPARSYWQATAPRTHCAAAADAMPPRFRCRRHAIDTFAFDFAFAIFFAIVLPFSDYFDAFAIDTLRRHAMFLLPLYVAATCCRYAAFSLS